MIPQQGRWRLIDGIVEQTDTLVRATGHFGAEHCEGHFPDDPVVPGVLLLEGLAQTMLVLHQSLATGSPLLAGADRVRFKAAVRPPATVEYTIELGVQRGDQIRCTGTARCEGQVVCTATLSGALA